MREIERYFRSDEHIKIKRELKRLNSTLKEIAELFEGSFLERMKRWGYVWPHGEEGQYSYSTQAMCLVGVGELINYPSLMQDGPKSLKGHWVECGKKLIDKLTKNDEEGNPLFESKTYGEKDVLTASWIIEYFLGNKDIKEENFKELIGEIITIIYKQFDSALNETRNKRGVIIDSDKNQAGPHAFPLYLAVSALIKVKDNQSYIDQCDYNKTDIERIIGLTGDYFFDRLSKQLSLCHLNKFRFDAAELSFCLAGLVIKACLNY